MSFNQPFGAPASTPEAPAAEEPAATSLNPVVFGAAAIGGAALLGAAAWFFVLSGPEATEELAVGSPSVPAPSAAATPSAAALPTGAPVALPVTFNQELRDPFKPLVVEPVTATGEGPMTGGVGAMPSEAPTSVVAPGGKKPTATGPVLNPVSMPGPPQPTSTPTATPAPEDLLIASFGDTVFYVDGLEVTIDAPVTFTPSAGASYAQRPSYVKLQVSVINASQKAYDPSGFTVMGKSGNQAMSQVVDGANGLGPITTTVLQPNQELTFALGFGVTDPASIVLQARPGFDYETAFFTTLDPSMWKTDITR